MKGNSAMKRYEILDKLIADHDGIVQTSQVVTEGISKPFFYDYVKEKKMEQVAHGVYASADAWIDALYLIHVRSKQAVFSHETALFLYDLTDREPASYSITVKTGYNPTRLKADGVQVYTVKPELHPVGRTSIQTPFGHMVPVYDMERTICDLIRSRKGIEIQTFQDAIKQYVRRKDKNLRTLMQYATLFRVERILRQYLEVLL
jgi:predicted transcriptional regulator of viral defense system